MNAPNLWNRFEQHLCRVPALGLTLDISRMRFDDGFFERMSVPMSRAFEAMDALERGAIANPDENRMVGHYWLREPSLAPSADIAREIARESGIDPLTDQHWQVIRFMRNRYLETGSAPSIRTLGKESGVPIKLLYQLFPKGPAKLAAKIGGIPKPRGCI